ncbi:MAG: hypothetical protein LBE91_01325 [Tannerella sp.]|jgi:hypothetical protein|nr:hypothetical protein [Tannerella sp.]
MNKFISGIENLSKWYGFGIIVLYSLLLAEFYSTVTALFISAELQSENIFIIFSRISYALTILSGVIIWVVLSFLFHLTALLFNGQAQFKRFLYPAAYPYFVPAVFILAGILLMDNVQIPETKDIAAALMDNAQFKLSMQLMNYSFIPYYLIVAVFIKNIYNIKYIYSFLSVAIPIVAIWGITELFKLV